MGNVPENLYTYEVKPTNFFTLPAQKQAAVLSHFYSVLASIQKPLRVTVSKEPVTMDAGGEARTLVVTRTFMSSSEPLDGILEGQGYDYFVSDRPRLGVKKEYWKHVVLEDGRLARCFTLCAPSSSLRPAWAYSLLSASDMLLMEFAPIPQERAVAKLHRKVHLMRSTLSTSPKIQGQIQAGLAAVSELEKNNTRLLAATLNALVFAGDARELGRLSKKFSKHCGISLSQFDSTPSVQARMLGGWGKRLYLDLASCGIFYPFVSSDMLEAPNGIALGINYGTGAPVIFNYTMRSNYNILVLASSGSGKSVTAKLILKRMLERSPGALAFIVDPEGEYEKIAGFLGMASIRVTGGERLGLDPFRMFERPEDAAGVLAEMAQAPALVANSFLAKCGGAHSLAEFYSKLSGEEKGYLVSLVEGPMAALFEGEPMISDRTIFSLKGTYGEDRVARVLFLALARLWKRMGQAAPEVPKILLIDEGHLIFRFASASKLVDLLARMGRKRNVVFIFVSQRVEDVTRTEAGRAFFDNSETKVVLRNSEIASDELEKALGLSQQEKEMVLAFNPGEALLLTRDYRIRMYVTPSGEELGMFGTSPQGRQQGAAQK